MSGTIRERALRAAAKAGWRAARFGPAGKSLRFTKGRDEIIVHFHPDGKMRLAFKNGKAFAGGLKHIAEMFEERS